MKSNSIVPAEPIENCIHILRGKKVIIDQDLAMLYGVGTGALNQAVNRNFDRFPEDFAFRLNQGEWGNLISQFVISRWGGRRKLPLAFTEQGVAMLSGVLHSPQAVKVNIEIMRVFVRMRHVFAAHEKMDKSIEDLKSFVLKHSRENQQEFGKVWRTIEKLATPPPNANRIGFQLDRN
jgi:hypothetical protein